MWQRKRRVVAFLELHKHAVTLRAGVHRWVPPFHDAALQAIVLLGDLDFEFHGFRDEVGRVLRVGRAGQANQQGREFAEADTMVDLNVLDGVTRHGWGECFLWVLYDRGAATFLDGPQTRRAIIEPIGDNDSNHARAEGRRGRAKERVHGGAEAVFLRPPGNPHVTGRFKDQVMICRSHVDVVWFDLLPVTSVRSG